MKPAPFEYARAASVSEALLLAGHGEGTKFMAGGQTLGPMLNLRLVQPRLLVDLTRVPELTRVEEERDHVTLGACITHAAFEDGRAPDVAAGLMRHVARGIAYRAVRTRGTIGGSLAHADPAADWLSCLVALDAHVLIAGARGRRTVALNAFMLGAMASALEPGELLEAIRVPRLSRSARWGYHKICRKTGEFAEAIAVAVADPALDLRRLVAGATGGRPIVLDWPPGAGQGEPPPVAGLKAALRAGGYEADAYDLRLHAVALQRAFREATSR